MLCFLAYFGVLFPSDQEAAFSMLRVGQSVGFVISFAYGDYLCVYVKIYILTALMVLSIILCYVADRINDRAQGSSGTAKETVALSPEAVSF